MRIFIGSDHRGFKLKGTLIPILKEWGFEAVDLGPDQFDPDDDYNDYAKKVASSVQESALKGDPSRGILVCGSAHGMAIQANRFKNVRAILAYNEEMAKIGREHNNANVLCLSADYVNENEIKKIVDVFLQTEFSGEERHCRRIKKLDD